MVEPLVTSADVAAAPRRTDWRWLACVALGAEGLITATLPFATGILLPTKALHGDPLAIVMVMAWLFPLPLSIVLWSKRRSKRGAPWWTTWAIGALVATLGVLLFFVVYAMKLALDAEGLIT